MKFEKNNSLFRKQNNLQKVTTEIIKFYQTVNFYLI